MENKNRIYLIVIVSILIPLVVAFLLFFPKKLDMGGWICYLPHVNAIINTTTSVLLILALIAIGNRQVNVHKTLMFASLILGTLFLVSYVTYHSSAPSTVYGDADYDGILSDIEKMTYGGGRTVYLTVLLSHIGMSIVVVPFVLFAFYFALSNKFDKHKRIVKFTFPIWLFVSVTGVIVYLMIRPFYMN